MSFDGRLTRLSSAFSARERGVLLLKCLKGEIEEDPIWRATMPRDQYADFNGYIGLMNTCNIQIAHLITFIECEAQRIEVLLAWLMTLRLWEVNLAEVEFGASVLVREPVTESEHGGLLAKASAEKLTLAQAASHVVTVTRPWTDDDLREVPRLGEFVVKDDAWKRLCHEAEAELRRAIAAGQVGAEGEGRGAMVTRGTIDAWLGRQTKAVPEWGGGYDVRPDDDELIERDSRTLAHLRRATTTAPLGLLQSETRGLAPLIESLESQVRGLIALRWKDARTAELILEEVAREFGGEDPLKPATRNALERAKVTLKGQAIYFDHFGAPVELPEPTGEDMDLGHEILEKGQRFFG